MPILRFKMLIKVVPILAKIFKILTNVMLIQA
jgi:hypothetical protein